jgi:hypothetical protein
MVVLVIPCEGLVHMVDDRCGFLIALQDWM